MPNAPVADEATRPRRRAELFTPEKSQHRPALSESGEQRRGTHMVSTLGTRPNHYEMLGLEPTASSEEIREAFARQMRSPLRMTDIAQIGIAYSTLRDPGKRRDYDRLIGLNAKPEPSPSSIKVTYRPWNAFIASPANFPVKGGGAGASPPAPPAEPHVTAEPARERQAEPKLSSSIGEALRELAKPEPLRPPDPEAPGTVPDLPDMQAIRADPPERAHERGEKVIDWKYPLVAVGGVVLTAALLGAWAGMTAGSDAEAAQAERGVTVALPKARPRPTVATPTAPPIEAQPEWVDRAAVSASAGGHAASRQRSVAPPETERPESQTAESTSGEAPDPLAAEPAAAQAIAASMPLSGKLVARTIERIGYSCGEVASTATVEGAAPGTYKVTCSSGETYQATPVHGRYRFRRSGR